jgi:hypothetical protein
MPYIRIVRSDRIDRGAYEAVKDAIDLEHHHPLGLMMHAAGEVDGHWQVVSVWEAQCYAERFDRESLEPVLKDLAGGLEGRTITGYEVQHLITP